MRYNSPQVMNPMDNLYLAGIDIGSTTVKMVCCDLGGRMIFSRYRRHHALTVDHGPGDAEGGPSGAGNLHPGYRFHRLRGHGRGGVLRFSFHSGGRRLHQTDPAAVAGCPHP